MDFGALSIQSLIPKLQEDLKKIQEKVAAIIQEQLKIILMNGIRCSEVQRKGEEECLQKRGKEWPEKVASFLA